MKVTVEKMYNCSLEINLSVASLETQRKKFLDKGKKKTLNRIILPGILFFFILHLIVG